MLSRAGQPPQRACGQDGVLGGLQQRRHVVQRRAGGVRRRLPGSVARAPQPVARAPPRRLAIWRQAVAAHLLRVRLFLSAL